MMVPEQRTILTTLEQVKNWFDGAGHQFSFDWETTGLSYMKMEPVGISFCNGKKACYIDLWENIETQSILKFLGVIFNNGLFIAHNAKFDIKCCRKFCGHYPERIFCTYIASYLLDENRETHGLKVLAVQDLRIPIGEVQGWEKASSYGYHSKEWYRYCHNDAVWAWYLHDLYETELTEQDLSYLFYTIEMPFVFVQADIEINGVEIDVQKLDALKLRASNKLIELEDRMLAMAHKYPTIQILFDGSSERTLPVNFKSTPQLVNLLKEEFDIVVPKTKNPKTGKYTQSLDKNTLAQLKGKHPFIDLLIDYKKIRKLYDAYIIPTYDMIDIDGRVRPSVGIVKTGRTNFRNPNLQQLPNISKQFPDLNFREVIKAAPGYSLVGGDFSGQELRVLGEVSGDPSIIDAFKKNLDLHFVTANGIFNLGLTETELTNETEEHEAAAKKYKLERYRAKNGVNFPIAYGSSEYGISHNMGVPVETAKEWISKFFELYPRVKEAMEETRDELQSNGFVCTLTGRRRRFPQYKILPNYSPGKAPSKARCVRQAFNFKIQGFSADQIKAAACLCRVHGLKIVMIVHDEIVCESCNPQQDVRTLKNCMENAINLSIPFIADCKTGNNYAEIK